MSSVRSGLVRILAAAGVLIALAPAGLAGTVLDPPFQLPDFQLTERSGRTVSRADLKGHVWVASFVFTNCQGPCWQVSTAVARLRSQIEHRPDLRAVRFVSISVDPDYDKPEVLRKYADSLGAADERWLFLTGQRRPVYELIGDGFHLAVHYNDDPKAGAGYQVDHSTKLALVDAHGRVRAYFDATDPDDMARVAPAMRRLVWEERLPPINASLNGLAAVLIIAGYWAIRSRLVRTHVVCMVAALVASILFLAGYLYYHLVIKAGRPTPFTGTGWVRPAYFGVLLSHTVLAAVTVPLVLTTALLAIRRRWERHVRWARWALPVWLYVSVTGVVVYWMLYQLYPPG